MRYGIPTKYNGVQFRSRLEATYAAFFDLVGWRWDYEPVDLDGWIPDFWIRIPCGHSECGGEGSGHELYAEVRPYYSLSEFDGHPLTKLERYEPPHPTMLGVTPEISFWEMGHGAGGGTEAIPNWVHNWEPIWKQAKNLTQWKRRLG